MRRIIKKMRMIKNAKDNEEKNYKFEDNGYK